MKKVLFVIWSLERGGAERFLTSLLENWDQEKMEATLACLNWKGEWAKDVEKKGIRVIEFNKKDGLDLSVFKKLVKHIKENHYDVVNTHLWCADVYGRIAAFLCGVPVVVSTAQNVDVWKKWYHICVDRFLGMKTDHLIAVSDAVKDFYHKKCGLPLNKIKMIPNSVDPSRYDDVGDTDYLYEELNIKKGNPLLACVARLEFQKGHAYLIDALCELKDRLKDLVVLIVGKGEMQAEIEQKAKEKKVDHMLRFLGQRSDIPQILTISDALILPSLFEGLPLCVLEAMSARKPVIATDVGGTAELAKNNETALIVQPKDIEALIESIQSLFAMDDRGRHMGEKGRKRVEEYFSIQSAVSKTIELFDEIVR